MTSSPPRPAMTSSPEVPTSTSSPSVPTIVAGNSTSPPQVTPWARAPGANWIRDATATATTAHATTSLRFIHILPLPCIGRAVMEATPGRIRKVDIRRLQVAGFRNAFTRMIDNGTGGVVDRQDLRILRELMRGQMAPVSAGFRISYAALARRLAMDEGTVRNRVKKLHTAGIIRQWEVLLNPRLSGGGEINVWTDVAPGVAKDGLIQEILLLDGPVIIANFRGPFVAVVPRYGHQNYVLRPFDPILRLAPAQTH